MTHPEKGKGSKVPSRAASLQRMLEMERKQKDKAARQTQSRKMAPVKETTRKSSADRDGLPSMKRAAAEQGSPQVKTVTFLPSDDGQSDTSSICHSPTWDDYGKRRKEKEGAAREAKSSSVESVQTVARSPAFIGGVRLERERDATRRRLKDSRAPSETVQQEQASRPSTAEQPKRRETAPPVSYPPTASKTPFLKHTSSTKEKGHSRKRSGSFTGVVSKLFGSSKSSQDPQPHFERRDSQDSLQTVRSFLSLSKGSRGRDKNGSVTPQSESRAQSRESHSREGHSRSNSTPLDERRGGLSLPPLSWKNSRKKKTTSMVAIPPDSARRGSFSPDSSAVEQDKFSFLERPFSPPVDSPLSPTASLSASMKAKMGPEASPEKEPRPASPPPKKTFKEAIKAGFRSSMSPDSWPSHRHTETDDTFIMEVVETPPILSCESHPLQSHPVIRPRTSDRPPSSSRGPRRSDEQHAPRRPQGIADAKDSGASTSSSHPDSESPPPSPATTPDTSRPQSSKDNKHPRAEDLRKLPLLSLHVTNGPTMQHPYAAILGSATHYSAQVNAERPKGGSKQLVSQQTIHRSNFIEDLPGQPPLPDEMWSRSKPPPDTDQLSFTSALTSLDVKRSVQDLGLPSSEIALFSMDRDYQDATKATKVTLKRIQVEVTKSPAYAKKQTVSDISPVSTADTGFLPNPPHQALPPRASGRSGQALLPSVDVDRRSTMSHAHNDSLDSFLSPPTAASTYLQEARRAAPASPRAPTSSSTTTTTTTTTSNPSTPLPSSTTTTTSASSLAPRAFALAQPKAAAAAAAPTLQHAQQLPSGGPAVPNPRHSSLDTTGLKPIAKMFVECCHCKFYQDMPSRVYEAMARPEDTVRDKRLGVSGQVTTCVKCPWCSHNMSTQCCAGFAAVVYLREKLHGP
ncbi:hypothetical protein VSDG_08995 [Cytospora chrysosperma]|uniref:Uncharacterized protein n=1 Tax=Cytospora chrysosperma TaxID=252740 RepID=A0A423VCV7_CYTCH|nr:hypothetical protein VSDG_08995 [Valsa sordida]